MGRSILFGISSILYKPGVYYFRVEYTIRRRSVLFDTNGMPAVHGNRLSDTVSWLPRKGGKQPAHKS